MKQPVTIKDCMSATVVTFRPETAVLDAIHELVQHRISGAPVLDSAGSLVGIISERDCLRTTLNASYHGDGAGTVGEYMSGPVHTVDADTEIMVLAQMFLDQPYRRYPVLRDNRLVGIVSRRDVLRAIMALHRAY